jgi:2-methylcitrate dehydratase PrpD
LEAALSIRQRLNSQTRSICRVRLRVYPEATIYAGNRNPHAPITAQFSLSLGVAAGLRFGAMDPDLFRDERLNDPELRRLEQLVDIEPVPEWGQAQQRAAHLQVETSDGAVFEHSVDTLPGSPERPLTAEQVVEKFVRYSASSLNRTSAARFCSAVLHAAEETDFASVWHELMT